MHTHKTLHNKNIILTGALGILGTHFSRALVKSGANLIIADLDQHQCEKFAQTFPENTAQKIIPLAVDLAQETSIVNWRKKIFEQFESIDVLINNAALKSQNFFASLENFPLKDWEEVMRVNVTGSFLCAREIGSQMAKKGNGNIINISSIYGMLGPDQRIYEGSWYENLGGSINTPLVYSASKGAIIAMTKYLATYWGNKGVRTNALVPGGVSSGQNSEFSTKYSQRVPLGRMAQPSDLTQALLFLASDASSYMNGQNLVIDGGLSAW